MFLLKTDDVAPRWRSQKSHVIVERKNRKLLLRFVAVVTESEAARASCVSFSFSRSDSSGEAEEHLTHEMESVKDKCSSFTSS